MAKEDDTIEEYSSKWWAGELAKVEKSMDEAWRNAGDKVVARYLDDRKDDANDNVNRKKYNIFWANTEITKAALYATPPRPDVKRQHGDAKDDVARTAALILQRLLSREFEDDESTMHAAIQNAVDDRLIPGLGQVWLRYDVQTEKYVIPEFQDPITGEVKPAVEAEKIVDEDVICEYVYWRDFLHSAARTWEEVWWVARRCWMKRKSFIKRFGKAKYDELKDQVKDITETQGKLPKGFTKGRIEVFEIMCEDTNKVYWINRHLDACLDEKEDPLQLEGFFQCPKPLIATHTTNNFAPRSDYTMVQDQYEELDTLNERISVLTKALRVVGVYDKESNELSKMLTGGEFNMIAVDNWAAFAEKGGLKGSIDWFPVEVIAQVLERLMGQRVSVINQIYELTSISDIMRGASNPRDTLGAQKMKAQYSSVRLQLRQQEVSRFVGQILRIKCEIIARHFQPQTIFKKSSIDMTESVKYAQPAIELLKNYEASEYRIEIGEETLSLADYNAERSLRTEYLTAVGQFISQAGGIMQEMPAAAPYLLKMIAWVTSAFRGASDIETVLDEAIQQVSSPETQQQGQGADPMAEGKNAQMSEQARAQADSQAQQAKIQSAVAINQSKTQSAAQQALIKVAAEHMMPKDPPKGEA